MPPTTTPLVIPRAEHSISRALISDNALKVLYRLKDAGFRPDYVSVRAAEDLGPPHDGAPLRVLAAAWLGNARLIDNLPA